MLIINKKHINYKKEIFILFINKNIKMEQNVVKTIREAFKIAYINKILKESSESMAGKLNPDEFAAAEAKYPSWISGRLPLRWGKADGLSDAAQNYLIEKAVEEYKQSKNKKIHDAISTFYEPKLISVSKNEKTGEYESFGNKVYNRFKKDPRIISKFSKLGKKETEWMEDYQEVLKNAHTQALVDLNQFEQTIEKYKTDNPNGIGSVIMNDLMLEILRLTEKYAAVSKGGDAVAIQSIDEPGFDDEGGRKFDLPGGVEINTAEDDYQKMVDMITDFGSQAVDYFKSKGKEKNATLAREFFVERMENDEIYRAHPEWYEGKDVGQVSTDLLQGVLLPSEINALAERIGVKYGFPKNWLNNIKKSKNLSVISKLFKDKYGDYKEPKQSDDLIFEKFVQNNMDKIMKEVYRRMSK